MQSNQVKTDAYRQQVFCARLCLCVNLFLAVIKLTAGILGHSKAMVADGMHAAFDISADMFVILALYIANKPSDEKHPYGYKRYETLAHIVVSSVLVMISIGIVLDALHHKPSLEALNIQYILPVAAFAILVNEMTYRYTIGCAKRLSSDLLVSTAVHQRTDAGTSFVVLCSIFASMLGVGYADQIAAVMIAALIIKYALPAGWKGIEELLDRGLSKADVSRISSLIEQVPGVCSFHLLRTRQMASNAVLDVHIVVDSRISVSEGHYIGDQVLRTLKQNAGLNDVTVHVDSEDDQYEQGGALPSRDEIRQLLEEQLGIELNELTTQWLIHYKSGCVDIEFKVASQAHAKRIATALNKCSLPDWVAGCDVLLFLGN